MCVVSSSPLQDAERLKIVFNIIEQQACNGRYCDRRGVCTGWLSDLTLPMLSQSDSLENSLGKLALTDSNPALVRFCFHGFIVCCYLTVCNTVFV